MSRANINIDNDPYVGKITENQFDIVIFYIVQRDYKFLFTNRKEIAPYCARGKKKYRSTLKINWSFVGDEPRPYFISLFLHLLFLPRPPNIYRKTVIPRLEKYSLK